MTRIITLFFLLHGFVGLQRSGFANEVLALLGGILFCSLMVNKKVSVTYAHKILFLFLMYGTMHVVLGLIVNKDAGVYEKLRTLPIFYSAFCFYVGYHVLYAGLKSFLTTKCHQVVLPGLVFSGVLFGPKIVFPAMLSLVLTGVRTRRRLYTAVFLTVLLSIPVKLYLVNDQHNDVTVIVMLAFLIVAALFEKSFRSAISHQFSPYIFFLLFVVTLLLVKLSGLYWSDFYVYGYDYFSFIKDPNTIWRLMFWAKTINDLELHQWFIGIGLGTPIFDVTDPDALFITLYDPDNSLLPYTLGLHNSLVTFFVRFGLIGVLFLFCIVFGALSGLCKNRDVESEALMVALILFFISALFNVVLESALFAGIFWVIIGMAYRRINSTSKVSE